MSFVRTSLRGFSLTGRGWRLSWLSTSWKMGPWDDERVLLSLLALRLLSDGMTRVSPEPAGLFM